jgi:hypothetical protein
MGFQFLPESVSIVFQSRISNFPTCRFAGPKPNSLKRERGSTQHEKRRSAFKPLIAPLNDTTGMKLSVSLRYHLKMDRLLQVTMFKVACICEAGYHQGQTDRRAAQGETKE